MIGRKKEIRELNRLYDSNKAELVAIYGRLRVGKTYLIDQVFKDRVTFKHAGLSPIGDNGNLLRYQLENFYYSLISIGVKADHIPNTWLEAFFMLRSYLDEIDDGSRQLIVLDELPWMDTPRSGFITAFEAFWNNWACHKDNVMVIVCGSANAWIIDKLINNHGGLYNRVTYEIKLLPFTLNECKQFFRSNNNPISEYDIVQSYMILGGIPYYLGYFDEADSLPQTVDKLFFSKNRKLKVEYDRLFTSVFNTPEVMKKIVSLLSTKSIGYTRLEISNKLDIANGGTLTNYLNALIASDFIVRYVPFGKKKQEYYKLIDPFCIFYLHFVEGKNYPENY